VSLVALMAGMLGAIGLGMIGAMWLVPRAAMPAAGNGRAEFCGTAILLGVGFVSWLLYLWSLVGGPLNSTVSWTLTGLGWCGFAWAWWRRRSTRPVQAEMPPSPAGEGGISTLARCCRWLVVAMFAIVLAQAVLTPQRFWDERAIFAIKGKVLFLDGTIHSGSLSHPDFVQGHPRYPLLLPLAEAHIYELLGEIDDRWGKVVFPLLYGGLVLTYAGVLSRRFGAGCGWLFALLLATTPALFPYELGVLSGQADAPVACFHGAAVLLIWDMLRGETGVPGETAPQRCRILGGVLIGFLAASAAFTKDEGIAFLAIDGIALSMAWCWGRFRGRRRSAAEAPDSRFALSGCGIPFLAAAAVVAVLLGPWFWHRRELPTATEMQYLDRLSVELLVNRWQAVQWLVPHMLRRMFLEWREWGLQWWLLLAALITAPRRALAPEQVYLLLSIVGAIAALIVAGLIAPADLHDHIGGSSHRYLMQIAPLALLFAAGQWGSQPAQRT
jgi:hypothetical protein